MSGFGMDFRSSRRRATLGPAPTLTSAKRTALAASASVLLGGGDGLTLIGANFVAGATLELTGPANYSIATTGSGTTLTVASMPAILKGLYTVKVKNPDGQQSAGTQPLIAVAPPATKALAHYISQGVGSDYSAGIRPALASAGLSGSTSARRQQTDALNQLPTNGPVIDGVTTVHYGGSTFNLADKSALRVASAEPLIISATAWHFIWMGYVYDAQGAGWIATGGTPSLAICSSAAQLQVGKVAGVMQAGVCAHDGAYKGQSVPCTGNAWHMLQARLFAGLVQVKVDNGAWSAGVACGAINPAGYPVQTGNYGAAGYWSANGDNVFFIADVAVSDPDAADIYDYAKYYLTPSAGLP